MYKMSLIMMLVYKCQNEKDIIEENVLSSDSQISKMSIFISVYASLMSLSLSMFMIVAKKTTYLKT